MQFSQEYNKKPQKVPEEVLGYDEVQEFVHWETVSLRASLVKKSVLETCVQKRLLIVKLILMKETGENESHTQKAGRRNRPRRRLCCRRDGFKVNIRKDALQKIGDRTLVPHCLRQRSGMPRLTCWKLLSVEREVTLRVNSNGDPLTRQDHT